MRERCVHWMSCEQVCKKAIAQIVMGADWTSVDAYDDKTISTKSCRMYIFIRWSAVFIFSWPISSCDWRNRDVKLPGTCLSWSLICKPSSNVYKHVLQCVQVRCIEEPQWDMIMSVVKTLKLIFGNFFCKYLQFPLLFPK